jgi:hypothetical protein
MFLKKSALSAKRPAPRPRRDLGTDDAIEYARIKFATATETEYTIPEGEEVKE